ncbi:class I SAM-dependent methyltransferase [Thermoflexus sp.]|uniref:class I SAM-dependent methyltransferase n=1 Tax=Thermoflexus sp. TaxID=1969742 RepID=UPI002ADDE280|nr:class I SAM-dependent methyltransferase [Thermoflexus sp.]
MPYVFEFDQVFDEDYLFFYGPLLTPERSDQEAEVIAKILGLAPGVRILDVACGHGRIASRLARRGCRVVGLDRSSLFLNLARREAQAQGLAVHYVQGDMRLLPTMTGIFDAGINWFTSFGYFEDSENRQVLRELFRVLKPGGRVIIETMNRDRLLKEFLPFLVTEREGHLMVDHNRYDPSSGRIETERIVIREGRMRRFRFSVRLFTFPELRDWLEEAGFREVQGFDERGEPYALTARRMIVMAVRPTM